ncbi:carboxypeptidase-like regulatory domain-containing protein [Billgrantia gudaonensis]|uniref:Carboxypeptidase regulatory-like domain-containing protein n=1 Tax=Billgrantia gudaonensis TaxID=376427 RepID=A0A1G8VAP4_9GAMM|nr:carboxypeptidase-like regulatory domain-containing protein [Halomonas gudaonensis]SDJ62435.1 hypothetical protein SAMN04487954_106123 [Halomonas gudaonensis]
MKAWIIAMLLGLTLAGCQMMEPRSTTSPERIEVIDRSEPTPSEPEPEKRPSSSDRVARKVAFPESEYARLEKCGTAAISGRLTVGGRAAAQAAIAVAPVTTYSAEAAEKALAGVAVEPADPRAREYTHTTRTDGSGRFKLSGLPSGEFYVSGSVENPRSGNPGIVIRQVSLGPGQHLQLELSR